MMSPTTSGLARFTQLHESPAAVALWHRWLGPIIRWSNPGRRRLLLAAGAVAVAVKRPFETLAGANSLGAPADPAGAGLIVVLLVLVAWLCYRAALAFKSLPEPIRRRPQITLHAIYWALLALLWWAAPAGSLWRSVLIGLAVTMPFLLWRCGYLLLSGQRGRALGTRFSDHMIYLFPVWGGSNTPYGKGLDYLARHEAQTEEELARSHLAGLKLFVLAGLWYLAADVMNGAVYGSDKHALTSALGGNALGIPRLSNLLAGREAAPLALAWMSLYAELVYQVLRHAAEGHIIIGVLRLFGFNVFRNTYKPLLAESIQAFWNRYYYYFKELMSELFFMPTFARRFKAWPRLRLFAAVLAAAFLGNAYYHLFLREELIVAGDALALWNAFNSRVFYCFLLAVGIFVSMLREQARAGQAPAGGLMRRGVRILGVWTFFALIYIWNAKGGAGFGARTEFFLGLFGLG